MTAEVIACPIPDEMSFVEACIIPVCMLTALTSLFNDDTLALSPPTISPQSQGKIVLVWGGSSSVGSNAIQLLRLAGYEVVTTASPRNHDFVKTLGATIVIDHSSSTAKQEILDSLKGKELVGALDAIGFPETLETCIQILLEHPDAVKKVSCVRPGLEKAARDGVQVITIHGTAEIRTSVAGRLWREYVPDSLKTKRLVPKPDPEVVGNGLEEIQKAVDLIAEGVSAKKLVVTL